MAATSTTSTSSSAATSSSASASSGIGSGGAGPVVTAVPLPKTTTKHDVVFKMLMLGESGVGKTALAGKAADDYFEATFISTVGVDFKIMFVDVQGKIAKLQIWDSAGQERFRTITANYFRRADGVFLVFDMNDQNSLDRINTWIGELKRHEISVPIILLGNKCDLPNPSVKKESAQTVASKLNLELFYTSAKTGQGVYQAIGSLVSKMLSARRAQAEAANAEPPPTGPTPGKPIVVQHPEPTTEPNKGCC